MSDYVLAAIDGSHYAESVCDYAVWAATALSAPLRFLHTVDNHTQVAEPDLTGHLGLGTREHLLEQLSDIEEQRGKLARQILDRFFLYRFPGIEHIGHEA